MVSSVDLGSTKDHVVSVLVVGSDVVFNFVKVDLGCPAVGVDDRQKDVLLVDHQGLENGAEALCAPRNVRGLSLLLELAYFVPGEAHESETSLELFDEPLCLFVGALLVLLHGQENHVGRLGPFLLLEDRQSFCEQLDVFFVAGNDEGVVNLLVHLTECNSLFLGVLGSFENSEVFNEYFEVRKNEHDGLEG
jgi:hypothetical protein